MIGRIRLLALLITVLGLPASAAFAQIDLTWDNCVLADLQNGEPPPTSDKTFVCTTPETYRLHGSFKSPISIPDFIAMDIWIELQQEVPGPVVPFYRHEGGCNPSGITFRVDKTASGAGGDGNACARFKTLWGNRGEETAFADTEAYYSDSQGIPGRAVLLAAIARSSEYPTPLLADTNYYAFHLIWTTNNWATCPGCGTPAGVTWSSATLYGRSGQIVTLRGASSKATQIRATIGYATPTRKITWGQLKSIYR